MEDALLKLHRWVHHNGWAGYDPYDVRHWYANLPRFLRHEGPIRYLAKLPIYMEAYRPLEIRRILGVKQRVYPKAMGLFTDAYARMYTLFNDEGYLQLAEKTAQWLINHVSRGYKGAGWGLPIDWQSRIFIPQGTPCGIVGVICGEGFWRLYEATGESRYLEWCCKICEGFLRDLNIDRMAGDAVCFSFTPLDHFHVHNANLWIGSFLVKVGRHMGIEEYQEYGIRAAEYALLEQRRDGSLAYWGRDQDIDGARDHYHSGFEMRALHSIWTLTGENRFFEAVKRYFENYISDFFDEDGAPWRNPGDHRVVDIHGCAEAMICNAQLSDDFVKAKEILESTSEWIIKHMQAASGYFIYRIVRNKGKLRQIDIPYIRWGQAWMMRGLAGVLEMLRKNDKGSFEGGFSI